MKKISYSQIITYIECPYKWYLIYQKKVQQKVFKIQSIFGTAMHQTIQTFLHNYYDMSIREAKSFDYQKIFKENLIKTYQKDYQKNNNTDFVTIQQLNEICQDGIAIIHQVISKSNRLFKKKNFQLVGTQIQLSQQFQEFKQLNFIGFIDIILHDKAEDTYYIIDLKTSRFSWDDNKKKDYNKRLQLLLYKYFFAKAKKFSLDRIHVEFIILKRKIYNSQHYVSRIQRFVPPNSARTCNTGYKYLVQNVGKLQNDITSNNFVKNPSLWNCKYCPVNENPTLCDKRMAKK